MKILDKRLRELETASGGGLQCVIRKPGQTDREVRDDIRRTNHLSGATIVILEPLDVAL